MLYRLLTVAITTIRQQTECLLLLVNQVGCHIAVGRGTEIQIHVVAFLETGIGKPFLRTITQRHDLEVNRLAADGTGTSADTGLNDQDSVSQLLTQYFWFFQVFQPFPFHLGGIELHKVTTLLAVYDAFLLNGILCQQCPELISQSLYTGMFDGSGTHFLHRLVRVAIIGVRPTHFPHLGRKDKR